MHTDTCTSWVAAQIFSLTKRLLWPAFSDYAHFSFISSCFFFQCAVKYPSNTLPPSYMTHTSSRIFWSFHTSYRVCLVPAEGDRTAFLYHTEGVGSRGSTDACAPGARGSTSTAESLGCRLLDAFAAGRRVSSAQRSVRALRQALQALIRELA